MLALQGHDQSGILGGPPGTATQRIDLRLWRLLDSRPLGLEEREVRGRMDSEHPSGQGQPGILTLSTQSQVDPVPSDFSQALGPALEILVPLFPVPTHHTSYSLFPLSANPEQLQDPCTALPFARTNISPQTSA